MTDRDRSDRVAEYVAVLRGFGLSDGEILAVHDAEFVPAEFGLAAFLDHEFESADERTLYRRLHDALAESNRGIDADREYWPHAPAAQLDAACRAHGWRVNVSGEGPLSLTVTSPDGEDRQRTFEYPESSLGEHNYPALAAAVADLLDGLRFALLSDVDGRWRFVLVESDLLAALRERYGDRIKVFRRPLLRARQPVDFAADDAVEPDRGTDLAGIAGDAFAESVGTGPRVHRSSRPIETEMEVSSEPERIVGESIEPVFESLAESDPPRPSDDVVDGEVETLLSDLDRPERRDDADEVTDSEEGTVASAEAARTHATETVEPDDDASGFGLVGGGPKTTVVEDDLTDVFESLEGTNPPARAPDSEQIPTDELLTSVEEGEADDSEPADEVESVTVGDSSDFPADEASAESESLTLDLPEETTNFGVDADSETAHGVADASNADTEVESVDVVSEDEADSVPWEDERDTVPLEADLDPVTTEDEDDAEGESITDDPADETVQGSTDESVENPANETADDADDSVDIDESVDTDEVTSNLVGEESARIVDDELADHVPVGGVPADEMADAAHVDGPDRPGSTDEGKDVTAEIGSAGSHGVPADEFDVDPTTPSIDEIELDVDDADVPAFDEDEETDTDGPLAGAGLGGDAEAVTESDEPDDTPTSKPDVVDDSTGDALKAPFSDDEYPDVLVGKLGDSNDDSNRGPVGRLVAWLRGLF